MLQPHQCFWKKMEKR